MERKEKATGQGVEHSLLKFMPLSSGGEKGGKGGERGGKGSAFCLVSRLFYLLPSERGERGEESPGRGRPLAKIPWSGYDHHLGKKKKGRGEERPDAAAIGQVTNSYSSFSFEKKEKKKKRKKKKKKTVRTPPPPKKKGRGEIDSDSSHHLTPHSSY